MKSKVTYYMWKDKDGIHYMTDYKQVRADGKVKIDGHGFMEVELVCTGKSKAEIIDFAQKQTLGGD